MAYRTSSRHPISNPVGGLNRVGMIACLIAGLLAGPARYGFLYGAEQATRPRPRPHLRAHAASEAMKVFHEAKESLEAEDWAKAAQRFYAFVTRYPKGPQTDAALYWLAFTLKKQGKFQMADQMLERLVREFPQSGWVTDAKSMRVEMANPLGNGQVIEEAISKNEEEIKLIALQSLFEANPERATALGIDLVKSESKASGRLKEATITLLGKWG